MIKSKCQKSSVNIKELKSGSKRAPIAKLRSDLAHELVNNQGTTLAQAARLLGVSTSGFRGY